MPSNSKFLSSNVKFWPFTISNRFLCIRRNSYPIFFLSTLSQIKWTKSKTLLCIVIEIGKVMRDLLFWYQMYLYSRFIRLCRCSFGNWCICNSLIFAVVDALLGTNVNILYVLFTSWTKPIHYLQKNWYKKFERIWSERWRHLERKFLRLWIWTNVFEAA